MSGASAIPNPELLPDLRNSRGSSRKSALAKPYKLVEDSSSEGRAMGLLN